MPTTFMGRDNNNNPCYHVRKPNGLSLADMRVHGPVDNTLFHSSLPYLEYVYEETVGIGNSTALSNAGLGMGGYSGYVFYLSANIKNYLANGYGALVTVTWSDGSTSNMEMNYDYFSYNKWAREQVLFLVAWSYSISQGFSKYYMQGLPGFHALNYNPEVSNSLSSLRSMTGYNSFAFYNDTTGSGSTSNASNSSSSPFLTTDSKAITFITSNANYSSSYLSFNKSGTCYSLDSGPTPSSLTFRFVNLRSTGSSLYWSALNPNYLDILVSSTGLYVGGSPLLSGKSFPYITTRNAYNGSSVSGMDYLSPAKLHTYLSLPYDVPAWGGLNRAAFTGHNQTDARAYMGLPFRLSSNGSSISAKSYYAIRDTEGSDPGSFATYNNATIGYYSTDVFNTLRIPSSPSTCTFTKDNLYINNVKVFDQNMPLLAGATRDPIYINIPAFSMDSVNNATGTDVVVASFNIINPAKYLYMLYTTGGFTSNTLYTTNDLTGSTASISVVDKPNLNFSMVSMSEGDMVHLFSATNSGDKWDFSIGGNCNMASVVYAIRRDGNILNVIRRVFKHGNATGNNINLTVPGFRFGFLQLSSAF